MLLAALIGLYFVALWLRHWDWERFGVPAIPAFPFYDLRDITTGWECTRRGIDVVPLNPCDPGMRPLAYPRIWLIPSVLGLGEESTFALGIAIATIFFLAAFAVIGRIGSPDAFLYGAVLCSPAVMLAVERGNVDLVVFAVLVLALMLLRRSGRAAPLFAHALFLLAAMLKLYPVLGWAPILDQPRKRVLAGAGGLVLAFAAYALLTRHDVERTRALSPQEVLYSFGAGVPIEGADLGSLLEGGGRLAVVAFGLVLALVIASFREARPAVPLDPGARRELDAFWCGAGIYVGAYALLDNFNYRLIFLIFTMPQLLRWSRDRSPAVPLPSLGLTAIILSFWLSSSLSSFQPFLGEWWERASTDFPYDEIVNWFLFAYLAAALALTLPQRLARSYERSGV